jgi:hypothetical protein
MVHKIYPNFDLYISKEGDRYMAEVRDSPAGVTGKVALNWPFGPDAHEYLMLRLENAILKGRGYRHGPLTSEEKMLREFGSDVFRAVFRDSDSVARRFATSLDKVEARPDKFLGLRLRLHVEPPELARLPWEYMFDASTRDHEALQNFLCLRNRSPLVRFLDVDGPGKPWSLTGPLKILCMIANPRGEWEPLDTEGERHRIEEALSSMPNTQVKADWVLGGTLDDLFEKLRRREHHIFHFIGHGGTDTYVDGNGQSHPQGFVVMHDGLGGATKVSASRLAFLLSDSSIRLAVLNCCDSARGGNSLSSTGAALVNAGVSLAVAMQFAISNGAAARFAGMFYKSLVSGEPVERALTDSRRFMSTESALEWGIPVLFAPAGASLEFEVKLPKADAVPALATSPKTEAQQALRQLFKRDGTFV